MSRLYLSCNHFKSCNNSYKICSLLHVWTRKYFGLHYLLLITASILVTFSHAYLCNVIWLQRFYQAVALTMSFITLFLQQKSSFLVSCTQGTRPPFVVCSHPHHRMAEVGQVLRKQFCPGCLQTLIAMTSSLFSYCPEIKRNECLSSDASSESFVWKDLDVGKAAWLWLSRSPSVLQCGAEGWSLHLSKASLLYGSPQSIPESWVLTFQARCSRELQVMLHCYV